MSSIRQPIMKTFIAGEDLSSDQYKFVKLNSSGQVVKAAAAAAIGVLQNAPASGEPAEIALMGGGGLVKLGGTVAIQGEITSNASSVGTAAATTNFVAGVAMAAGVSGDVVEAFLTHYYKV